MSAALTLGACQSPAGKVSVLQSATASISPGATYAWAPLVRREMSYGDPRIDNDIIRQRIRTAIDTNLSAKGFRLIDDPNAAQLLVSYYVGLRQATETRVDTYGGYYGYGYGWGMYGAPMDVDVRTIHYTEGTLVLDLKDKSSGELAWRATSQKRIDESGGGQERINAVIAELVKSLPGTGPV
jgi:hypothetical protein